LYRIGAFLPQLLSGVAIAPDAAKYLDELALTLASTLSDLIPHFCQFSNRAAAELDRRCLHRKWLVTLKALHAPSVEPLASSKGMDALDGGPHRHR
jgi:hypothetical protein